MYHVNGSTLKSMVNIILLVRNLKKELVIILFGIKNIIFIYACKSII